MVAQLLCDDPKNWIAVAQQLTSPDFPALNLAIQGLGVTHHWLRKMEYELIMDGLVAEKDPELYENYQRTWAAQLRQVEVQPTFYFAMYWVKSLAEVVAIIRNGRGVRGGTSYKERLNELAGTINLIRQPFAKHQIAGSSELLLPMPALILGDDNCIGWHALDKNAGTSVFKGVFGRALHQGFIDEIAQLFAAAGELVRYSWLKAALWRASRDPQCRVEYLPGTAI